MSLVAPVDNGQVNISETSQETEKKTGSALDKDDFLMLLVTQMKYQDPLEPESNTEYVAQLAQFSSLEQMQNLNSTATNTSAYTLVGKQVRIRETSETGAEKEVQGMVEYVKMQNGKPYVSVNGEMYSYDDIVEVIDDNYLISQYIPSVKQQEITYLHHDPQNAKITGISMGSNGYEATSLAVALMAEDGTTTKIDADKLSYKNGVLTIDKSVFASLPAGKYVVGIGFDDINKTVDYASVTLTIKGNVEKKPDTAGKDAENTDKVTDGTDKDAENTDKTENTGKETAQA
ncbi:flagellar hook capping FlgD N-terminal domain-containing protein [Jutongia sp.]|uniref:flagellar hook capping FlgD N-terminal domain-containing protein n=1 Tax=Jutongia sp. TaxID=2944204 RepID=UPI00307A87AA